MTKKQQTIESVPALPAWLNTRTWQAFLAQRTKKKAANTEYALELVLRKLDEMRVAGHDPNSVLDASIQHGWAGVFLPKEAPAVNGSQHGSDRKYFEAAPRPTQEERASSSAARDAVMAKLRPNLRRVR